MGKDKIGFVCRKCRFDDENKSLEQRLRNLNQFDLGWLVGLIEGEGCFYCKESKCKLSTGTYCYPLAGFALMSTDYDVMQRFSALMDIQLKGPYYEKNKKERKVVWTTQITGNKAVVIMNVLRSYLGSRRQEQIDSAIAWQKRGRFETS